MEAGTWEACERACPGCDVEERVWKKKIRDLLNAIEQGFTIYYKDGNVAVISDNYFRFDAIARSFEVL